MSVSGTTKSLKNIMRMDEGVNGDAQYIEQITWILFLKAFDFKEQEWELIEKDYYPVIPQQYQWRNWAENPEEITGDTLLDHVGKMFKDLGELDTSDDPKGRKWLIKNTIEGSNNFMKKGGLLRRIINKINKDIDFNTTPSIHLFNDLYESMLKDLQSAGKSGEYYTPRPITNFIVDKIAPKLGESVLDPACGTGGFLASVINSYKEHTKTPEDYRLLQQSIQGIEKKPLPYLLGVTNLIIHGIDVPNIRHDNTLRTPTADYTPKDRVDVIVTNPPFGGAEDKAISRSVSTELRNSETADLFLVHIMSLLKKGGRCGLVLPDGFLFGTGIKASIKKKLVEEYNLHTIIRLPKSVFSPYTGINTNLLFFTKGKPTKGVWYYRLEMAEGYKNYSKTKPMEDKHFQPVHDWWENRVESDCSQLIPVGDIKAADYSLDFCGFPHDTVKILPPEEFIAQYLQEKSIISDRMEQILTRISASMKQDHA